MSASACFTVPQLAERWGVTEDHVGALIRSGALKAFSVALTARGKRPRWRIRETDALSFEEGRAATAPAKPTRRKRSADPVPDYIG